MRGGSTRGLAEKLAQLAKEHGRTETALQLRATAAGLPVEPADPAIRVILAGEAMADLLDYAMAMPVDDDCEWEKDAEDAARAWRECFPAPEQPKHPRRVNT